MDSKNRLAFEKGGLQVSVTFVYLVELVFHAFTGQRLLLRQYTLTSLVRCTVMWSCLSSGSLSPPRTCKNLLTRIFQNETRNKLLNVSYTIFLTKVFFLFKSKVEHLQEELKSFGAIKVLYLQGSFQFSFVECELNLEASWIIDVLPNCSAPWNSVFEHQTLEDSLVLCKRPQATMSKILGLRGVKV